MLASPRIVTLVATVALTTALGLSAAPNIKDSWHQWRGPNNNGVAVGDAPLNFSATDNVKWKVSIPGRGNSTPVVWGDTIYLTTAVPTEPIVQPASPGGERRGPGGGMAADINHKFVVMAIDKNTGKVIWKKTATETKPHEGYHRQYGSFASNSPVTDGETLYVNFGSRGLYAYDLKGNLKWKKDLGTLTMRLFFGEGIAPVIHGNYLVLQNDHEGDSYIVVLDKRDGKEVWRAERDERSSWPQPLVVEYKGQNQLITSATRVRSYELETGKLIWEAGGLGGNAIPAVVNVDNEMIVAMTGWRDANALGIKLGGEGDLTDNTEYIAWTNQKGNSYTPSPVLQDGILYFASDRGMMSAVDAKTGEQYYLQQRLPEIYSLKASPVAANGKLYVATEQGDIVVLKLGKTYEVLTTNKMGDEMFVSSPVVVGGDLFLRSQDELFCISSD